MILRPIAVYAKIETLLFAQLCPRAAQANLATTKRQQLMTQQIKIIISFFQISTTLAFSLNLPFPKSFRSFMVPSCCPVLAA